MRTATALLFGVIAFCLGYFVPAFILRWGGTAAAGVAVLLIAVLLLLFGLFNGLGIWAEIRRDRE